MPNIEWEVPHDLVTPAATILFNQVISGAVERGRIYVVQPGDYKLVPSLRVTEENLSQSDGQVIHPRWKTGVVATLAVSYYLSMDGAYPGEIKPAFGQELREMHEDLMGALESIRELNFVGSAGGTSAPPEQRLIWTPTGYSDRRMLDDVVLASWPDPSRDQASNTVTFTLETPFPYGLDLTQTQPVITGGVGGTSGTLVNTGNTNFFPVIEVSQTDAFTIRNTSVLDQSGQPYQIIYNSGLAGAVPVPIEGAEIDCFRGTIFAGGDGADLIAGVDPTLSDFIWLAPGNNVIEVINTTAQFKLNNSWA